MLVVGDISLRFSASPLGLPTPTPPPLRSGRPSGGFRARGGSAAACEGARDLPSLPPFINGKPETPALAGWGGWWQPPGVRLLQPDPGLAAPAPSRPRGARPPLAFSSGAGPLGGLRRRPGGAKAPGRASSGRGMAAACLEARTPRASLVRSPACSWTPRPRTRAWVPSAIVPTGSLDCPVRGRPYGGRSAAGSPAPTGWRSGVLAEHFLPLGA